MTNGEAIKRLEARDRYLQTKIEGMEAAGAGKSAFWLRKDRESIMIAIAAIGYVEAMQEYEASQIPQ
jgi:hypothetical protein